VESEGHGAFYSLISFSLAVVLYPQYQWVLSFVSSGFVSQVDSALLILGATGVITGILYTIPLDRIIDWVIKIKVGHVVRVWRFHFPKRGMNNELIWFIAGIDYLTSTWRTPSWVSIEDSCEHTVSSAMNDPSIQKEIWGLKNRSVVGLTFLLLGLAIHGVNSQVNNVLLHSTICAFDTDGFLVPREKLVRTYLRNGGQVVLRVVSFHFDDTTEEGLRLWNRQDNLMSGAFGSADDLRPLILENPARLIRGKKQRNPTWKYLTEWAYHKAPTTKDHKFSTYNHNWTAGVLYDMDTCWVGCRNCPVQCHTRDRQTTFQDF